MSEQKKELSNEELEHVTGGCGATISGTVYGGFSQKNEKQEQATGGCTVDQANQ